MSDQSFEVLSAAGSINPIFEQDTLFVFALVNSAE